MVQPARPPRPNVMRRIVMSLVLAAAVAGFVYVGLAPTGDRGPTAPPAVEAVFPQGGNLELRQTAVYADLAPGFTGRLLIDGEEVVADDLQVVDAINTVALKPQSYSKWAHLAPGRHCATVLYHRSDQPAQGPESRYTWCFSLH